MRDKRSETLPRASNGRRKVGSYIVQRACGRRFTSRAEDEACLGSCRLLKRPLHLAPNFERASWRGTRQSPYVTPSGFFALAEGSATVDGENELLRRRRGRHGGGQHQKTHLDGGQCGELETKGRDEGQHPRQHELERENQKTHRLVHSSMIEEELLLGLVVDLKISEIGPVETPFQGMSKSVKLREKTSATCSSFSWRADMNQMEGERWVMSATEDEKVSAREKDEEEQREGERARGELTLVLGAVFLPVLRRDSRKQAVSSLIARDVDSDVHPRLKLVKSRQVS